MFSVPLQRAWPELSEIQNVLIVTPDISYKDTEHNYPFSFSLFLIFIQTKIRTKKYNSGKFVIHHSFNAFLTMIEFFNADLYSI